MCANGIHYDIGQDSLESDWNKILEGELGENRPVFLNPPYSKLKQFLAKAYIESLKGVTVVCLVPTRSDTAAWHDFVMRAAEIRFIKGRVKFELPDNLKTPKQLQDGISCAPFPSCIVVFKNHYGTTQISRYIWK